MFEILQFGINAINIVAVLSIVIAIIVLPLLIYSKSKNKVTRFLLIGNFMFIGGMVFTIALNSTSRGRSLISYSIENKSVFMMLIGNLGLILVSISAIMFPIGMWLYIKNIKHDFFNDSANFITSLKQISACGLVATVIILVGYNSYLNGVRNNYLSNSIPYMNILKMQNDCIEKDDYDCIKNSNTVALDVLAAHLERLKKQDLSDTYINDIDTHLAWWEKTKKSIESSSLERDSSQLK